MRHGVESLWCSVAAPYLSHKSELVPHMPRILLNLDVDDMDRAIAFYTRAFDLSVGRRFDSGFVELLGAEAPIYLLLKSASSEPFDGAPRLRDYARHWTPLHLDCVVTDLDSALEQALAAGAVLEAAPSQHAYGRLALLHDPFGHGLCLLQFEGKGYDEL
jgi:predicted enzyme related to lactoylglutathione lyase